MGGLGALYFDIPVYSKISFPCKGDLIFLMSLNFLLTTFSLMSLNIIQKEMLMKMCNMNEGRNFCNIIFVPHVLI